MKAKNETSLKAMGNTTGVKRTSEKKKMLIRKNHPEIPNLSSSVERDNLSAPRGIKEDGSYGGTKKLGGTRLT
jgi:hypothetical protein